MIKKDRIDKHPIEQSKKKRENSADLVYPPNQDIYQQEREETEINPEQITKNKTLNEKAGTKNEKSFEEDKSGDDLDVPGSELDDAQERLGREDEENNYYSLGGDNHNDLDENNV
jgi:hypothetical protein